MVFQGEWFDTLLDSGVDLNMPFILYINFRGDSFHHFFRFHDLFWKFNLFNIYHDLQVPL